jgi:hypothetical protein
MHKRSSPIAEGDGRAVGRQRLLGSEGAVVVVVVVDVEVEVKGRGTAQESAAQCSAGSSEGAWLASWLVDDDSDESAEDEG